LGGQRHRFRRRTDGHRVHSLASCPQPCPASGCISGPLPSATHGEASRNSSWLLKTSCSVPMLQERACPLPQQLAQRLLQGPHSLRGLAGCLGGQVHHTSLHHSPPRGHSSPGRDQIPGARAGSRQTTEQLLAGTLPAGGSKASEVTASPSSLPLQSRRPLGAVPQVHSVPHPFPESLTFTGAFMLKIA
jgi:hypothetical protein